MSLKTTFLKLFKWNTQDDEDLNSNFDIDAAMNDNWDMIDNAVSDLIKLIKLMENNYQQKIIQQKKRTN